MQTGTTGGTVVGWKRFFFHEERPYGMALMRMMLPWALMINIVQRWPYVREIFSTDGAPAPLADNFGHPGFLPEFSGPISVALFALLTFLFVTTSIGWCTRFSLLVSTVLYFYFCMIDSMSTITKYTVIATHLFLLAGLSRCGDVWSVDAWLRRRRGLPATDDELRSPVWPARLVQLLVGIVYIGAGITKMHTPQFFSGDQLMYWMMTYINNVHPLGDWLSQFPILLVLFGYITIVWEIVFVFTVFQPKFKWLMLGIGVFFHIMTAFTLGLFIFPLVMIASYMTFLTEDEIHRMGEWKWVKSIRLKLTPATPAGIAGEPAIEGGSRWGSVAAFALTAGVFILGSVEIEHWMDPYQIRTADGPLPLRELSDDEVQQLFSIEHPLRQRDKLLAFDLGTIMVGEHLVDRRREFRQGDLVIAQMHMNPPHEDMWVDCILYDARTEEVEGQAQTVPNRIITRVGQVLPREVFRGHFNFLLDEAFEPGEYFLRLRSSNEDVAVKKFRLLPKAGTVAAN